MKLNKKSLAIFLSKLKKQESVSASLEQYPTDSDSAAHILWHAYMSGDIEDKVVADGYRKHFEVLWKLAKK